MWITGDVDLPTDLVEALTTDSLVLFVGAGASLNDPSNLPLFPGLAKQLASLAAVPYDEKMPTDAFLGRLADRGDFDAHKHAKLITGSATSTFNSVHTALVSLAAAATPRIITTNYDDHLTSAAAASRFVLGDRYNAPALPLGSSFSGIVHLHGSVARPETEFVLTDRDFGHAYITDAWASRFLQGVFAQYTVLFVGYSHSDVVMNYLAMGLPPGARRFALTTDPADERWARLRIEPIGYPGDNHHVAAQLALEAWAARARMGLLDHRGRIRDIVAGGPPKTPVDIDYLDSMIATLDGSRFFAEVATDPTWLEWMESRSVFRSLFDSSIALEPTSPILAEWFSKEFAAEPSRSDYALATIQRLGQSINDELLNRLAWSTKELWSADTESARRWQALVASSLGSSTPTTIARGSLVFRGSTKRAIDLVALRRVLVPYLRLRKSIGWGDYDPIRPSQDLAWPIDPRALRDAISGLHPSTRPDDLAVALEQALLDAYDLIVAYDGEQTWDSLSFRRSAIEPDSQDDRDDVVDVIVDGLRDYGESSSARRTRLIERWFSSPRALLRRLAIHLLASSRRSPDNKLSRILDFDLLFDSETKHETYILLASAIADASAQIRARVLERVMQGPGDEDDEHRVAYSKFNLLTWLTRAAPKWRAAQNALRAIKAENQEFEERNRLDLDHEHWSGSWTPAVPITVDEWLQMVREEGPASGIDWLYGLDYSERQMDGPDWDGAQTLVRSSAEADPGLAVEVWDELVANPRDRDLDLRAATVFGWASTKIRHEWGPIIERAATLAVEPGQERAVADLALAVAKDETAPDTTLESVATMIGQLTASRAPSFTHQPTSEWMFLGLNSWPGSVGRFWIQHVARRWREAGDSWIGLDDAERSAIDDLVNGSEPFSSAARPVVGADLYFLFGADEEFTRRVILPHFSDSEAANAAQTWSGFLYHPRVNDRMIEAGFLEIASSARRLVAALEGGRLTSQYYSMLASICSFLDVSDDQRDQVANELIVADPASFVHFLDSLQRLLSRMDDPAQAGGLWRDWIGPLCERRLNGIPRSPRADELETWMNLLLSVGDALPSAIEFLRQHPTGFGGGLALQEVNEHLASTYTHDLLEYLMIRVTHTPTLDMMLLYSLREAVQTVASVADRSLLDPLFTYLRSRGVAADEWLSDE